MRIRCQNSSQAGPTSSTRLMLMDEPFGALDAQTREEMQHLLIELFNAHPCVIVFVTHDVDEALALGDRVLVLSTRPARLALDIPLSEPRPRSTLWQRSTEASRSLPASIFEKSRISLISDNKLVEAISMCLSHSR